MTYENGDIGGKLYHINRHIQPHAGLYSYLQEENEMFAKVSRTAKDVSHKLPELHSEIHDKNTLKRTLEDKLKQAPNDTFKNEVAVEVLVRIALDNGIQFHTSGDFESAYDSLNHKLREIYSKPSNTEIREALKSLVYNGFVIEAHHGDISAIVGSSNVDPYLNNTKPYVSKEKSNKHKKPNNHHSLRELGEKLHLVGHHK